MKSYFIATNGQIGARPFPNVKTYRVKQREVPDIHALYRLQLELDTDPTACVVRADPAEGTNWESTPRNKSEGAFVDVPRRWMMVDADKVRRPAGVSVIDDPTGAAHFLVDHLASVVPELEGVSAVVQFSASAGIDELAEAEVAAGMAPRWGKLAKGEPLLSGHVWFRLAVPHGEAELVRWAKAINAEVGEKAVDPATMQAVQVHYTAGPVFGAGLRDPLAGRRVVFIEGTSDEATIKIPDVARRHQPTGTASANVGVGFEGLLATIGEPHGFNQRISSAIANFIGANWPNPDLASLIAVLQKRILEAPRGARSDNDIERYASEAGLRGRIDWTIARETEKRAKHEHEASQPIDAEYPHHGVSLEEATTLADAAIGRFADAVRAGELPQMLLSMTVGGGKTEAGVRNIDRIEQAIRGAGLKSDVTLLVPRHDLGAELVERIARTYRGKTVAVHRGMHAKDPKRPGQNMCLDPEIPRAAVRAGLSQGVACPVCPKRFFCGHMRDKDLRGDIWLAAHNIAFHQKPSHIPKPRVVIIDEDFSSAALRGTDPLHRIEMPLSDLLDTRTGEVRGPDIQEFTHLRGRVEAIIRGHGEGRLLAQAFVDAGFTEADAAAWKRYEYSAIRVVKFEGPWLRESLLAKLAELAGGYSHSRPRLAGNIQRLLASGDAASVNVTVLPGGTTLRFEWREDFAAWMGEAAVLVLGATTEPEVAKIWLPRLEVVEINVAMQGHHVRQIPKEAGRSHFVGKPGHVRAMVNLLVAEAALVGDDTLVVSQLAVKELLLAELQGRKAVRLTHDDAGKALPDGTIILQWPAGKKLHMAHFGALTGMNAWRHVAGVVTIGRPAANRVAGERLAEILKNSAVDTVQDENNSHWPTVQAGIRLADGTGRAVRQPRHPDKLVEAVRRAQADGNVLQGIHRARGVQRDAATDPVRHTVIASLALNLTVNEVVEWGEALPCAVTVALAEALLAGRALPLGRDDLHRARPDLFETPKAAEHAVLRANNSPKSLMSISYKGFGGVIAHYRKPGARGPASLAVLPRFAGRDALEAEVGALGFFEVQQAQPQIAAPAQPAAQPIAPVLTFGLSQHHFEQTVAPRGAEQLRVAAEPAVSGPPDGYGLRPAAFPGMKPIAVAPITDVYAHRPSGRLAFVAWDEMVNTPAQPQPAARPAMRPMRAAFAQMAGASGWTMRPEIASAVLAALAARGMGGLGAA